MKRLVITVGLLAVGASLAAPSVVLAQFAPLPSQKQMNPQGAILPDDQEKPGTSIEPERGRTKVAPLPQIKRPPGGQPPIQGGKPPGSQFGGTITPRQQLLPPASPPPAPRPLGPSPRERVAPPPRRLPELAPQFPIKRPPRETIVRRRRDRDRIPPTIFLPPVIFPGIVIPDLRRGYVRDRLTWADGEVLYRGEGWVEAVLDVNARGRKLWFEVAGGRVRIDWAEIVFENGQTQVVDFAERSIGPGLYVLLDFPDGRRVDRVRIVAEAASREVRLTLRMEQ